MLDGYTRKPYNKLGGLVTSLDASQIPMGSAVVAEDVEFTARTVKSRSDITQVFQDVNAESINGLDALIRQTASALSSQMLIAYGSSGKLYKEDVAGSGMLTQITDLATTGLYMSMTTAYDRAFMAFSDLLTGQAAPKQYLQYQNQYYFDTLGIAPATNAQANAMTAASFAAGAPGDTPTGAVYYCVVLFQTRSGYISGILDDAFCSVNGFGLTANKQLTISNIPTGPTGTVARILAFTSPGASSAGPYYYIPTSYTLAGLNGMITSTVINDNTSTTVNLNFTDSALTSALEVTAYFDKMLVPNVVGAKFLPSLKRIGYWGYNAEPSTVFMSEPDDPETLYATQSRLLVAENNGQRVQSVFEFRSEIYVAKERGGHVLDASGGGNPATWAINERWAGVGPCGPRALDVCEEFVIFVHRSGLYRYEGGGPEWVSWEQSGDEGLWKRINWSYGHLISIKIDIDTKRVYVCVPLDQSTVPNKIIVLDYRLGFGSPVIQDYSSNLISSDGRKWSIWNIPCNQVVRIERVANTNANVNSPQLDNTQAISQALLASSMKDGAINMLDPGKPTDNGKAIWAKYQCAFQRLSGVLKLGGFDFQAKGNGQLGITQIADEDDVKERPPLNLKPGKQTLYTVKTKGQSPEWSVRVHTVNEGDWWEVGEAALWLNQAWPWNK